SIRRRPKREPSRISRRTSRFSTPRCQPAKSERDIQTSPQRKKGNAEYPLLALRAQWNCGDDPVEETATKPLSRLGKGIVVLFFVFLAVFGAHVEQRSAFLSRRMGDLDVFLRAAWAVRNDADLYAITSDNDWHYLYPPLYAIL